METVYPFGSKSKKVEQQDKSPKKVFVLGVNASAVHAKWIDADGNVKVNALPVASEPYIFWKGDNADQIIKDIQIPPELGKLIPVDEKSNVPLGEILDELYLEPLGYKREDAWLCNLLPYSRLNPNQKKAIETKYKPMVVAHNLPECTIPVFNSSELNNPSRLEEILAELEQSQADTILLLGDLPIKHFLSHFSEFKRFSDSWKELDDYRKLLNYGKKRKIEIAGKLYNVIPLTHPRHDINMKSGGCYWNTYHLYWTTKKKVKEFEIIWKKKDPSLVTKKPKTCPFCNSINIVSYIPEMLSLSEKLKKNLDESKIILKDCIDPEEDPTYVCDDCKKVFYDMYS